MGKQVEEASQKSRSKELRGKLRLSQLAQVEPTHKQAVRGQPQQQHGEKSRVNKYVNSHLARPFLTLKM